MPTSSNTIARNGKIKLSRDLKAEVEQASSERNRVRGWRRKYHYGIDTKLKMKTIFTVKQKRILYQRIMQRTAFFISCDPRGLLFGHRHQCFYSDLSEDVPLQFYLPDRYFLTSYK